MSHTARLIACFALTFAFAGTATAATASAARTTESASLAGSLLVPAASHGVIEAAPMIEVLRHTATAELREAVRIAEELDAESAAMAELPAEWLTVFDREEIAARCDAAAARVSAAADRVAELSRDTDALARVVR